MMALSYNSSVLGLALLLDLPDTPLSRLGKPMLKMGFASLMFGLVVKLVTPHSGLLIVEGPQVRCFLGAGIISS